MQSLIVAKDKCVRCHQIYVIMVVYGGGGRVGHLSQGTLLFSSLSSFAESCCHEHLWVAFSLNADIIFSGLFVRSAYYRVLRDVVGGK